MRVASITWFAAFAVVALLIGGASATAVAAGVDVIPLPNKVEARSGVFAIRAGTPLSVPPDARGARVAGYFAELMRETHGLALSTFSGPGTAHAIVFRLGRPRLGVNPEAYTLDVTAERIIVSASDPRGLLYGAVTLWQLCGPASAVSASPTVPALRIVDSPRFSWRGLMLDSARHYQSPEFILQFIDWMALHKLNVLHWHLTDDQAWRLEIKRYPRLTSVGAWRGPHHYGGFYTQETVRRIVAHAADRNITIVPEIDMPGHATAAIVAYPRLASVTPAPAVITDKWGVYANLYNVDESTFEFLENVLSEVVALFPGQYVHIGGDEAIKDQWKNSPQIQARMRELGIADENALQSYMVARVGKFLAAHHRRLVGWDEILEGGITPDATVMSWRGIKGALTAAAAGHEAVLSPDPTLYFDNRQSPNDTQPGRIRVISLEDVYRFDPMPVSLPADQRRYILGVQANIWTEHIRSERRVEYTAFPRAAAVAEVGWSPAASLDWSDFVRRLPQQMSLYQALNIHAFREPTDSTEPLLRRSSHQLASCTNKILLSLEDDAPLSGDRLAFMVDILNPCWIFKDADLGRVTGFAAAVGQVPFQFELGAGVYLPKLNRPVTAAGELEVRIDGCEGDVIARMPLQPAVGNDGVTELPPVKTTPRAGRHDVCLKFAQWVPDPLWVINWFQLVE